MIRILCLLMVLWITCGVGFCQLSTDLGTIWDHEDINALEISRSNGVIVLLMRPSGQTVRSGISLTPKDCRKLISDVRQAVSKKSQLNSNETFNFRELVSGNSSCRVWVDPKHIVFTITQGQLTRFWIVGPESQNNRLINALSRACGDSVIETTNLPEEDWGERERLIRRKQYEKEESKYLEKSLEGFLPAAEFKWPETFCEVSFQGEVIGVDWIDGKPMGGPEIWAVLRLKGTPPEVIDLKSLLASKGFLIRMADRKIEIRKPR
jgi:hypothetical protein